MSFQSELPHTILPDLISESQELLGKSDQQLSKELGFTQPNVITMIKAGSMKLPISKVQKLAVAIDFSESDLLRVVLRDQAPELLTVIDKIWAQSILTANERKLIESYRYLAKGHDVTPIVMDGQSIIALVTA